MGIQISVQWRESLEGEKENGRAKNSVEFKWVLKSRMAPMWGEGV